MHRMTRRVRGLACALTAAILLPVSLTAHPGTGIVVDRLGQIYFVDMVSGVWKIDTHGALTPIRDLNDLAAGPDGWLYYTEFNAIRRLSREGRVSTVAQNVSPANCGSVPGMGPADRPLLRGLAVDSTGTVYVAATGCGSVLRITPDGRVSTLFQTEAPWSPTGVALHGSNVYVLEFTGAASDDRRAMVPRVRRIAADGTSRIVATVVRR